MKKTLAIMSILVGMISVSHAMLFVHEDFDSLDGWTQFKFRDRELGVRTQSKNPLPPGSTLINTDSALYTRNWAQSGVKKSFDSADQIQLGTTDQTYHFSYQIGNAGNNVASLFYLAGSDFSLMFGTNYTAGGTNLRTGYVNANAFSSFTTFQTAVVSEFSSMAVDSLSSLFITGRLVTAADGTNTIALSCYNAANDVWYNQDFSDAYTFTSTSLLTEFGAAIDCPSTEDYTFDSLRIARGVDSYREVTGLIPEPALTAYGLLGLVSLAGRRRKR